MTSSQSSKFRAVVVVPPIHDFYATPHRMSSMGAHVVEDILHSAHVTTDFIDGMAAKTSNTIPLPPALNYLSPFIIPNETGKCSFFSHYRHFGSSLSEITHNVAIFKPDLCFIACFAFCYAEVAVELAVMIKRQIVDCVIVAGGAGVSVYPNYFLKSASIDYTLSGEAECILPPFLDFLKNGKRAPENVPALGWKKHEVIHVNSPAAPTTDSSILPSIALSSYVNGKPHYAISVSRGCNAACSFCANHLVHGTSFRCCSFDKIRSLLLAIQSHGHKLPVHFNFEDDNLLCDTSFFISIIEECKRLFSATTFTAENGLDYRLLTPALLEILIDYGFRQCNFTLASVAPEVLSTAGRVGGCDHFDALLACAERRAVPVISYIICGLPTDTVETIAANLRFLMHRPAIVGMSLFYPVPGLKGFSDRSFFDSFAPCVCCGSSAFPWNRELSTGTLVTAFRCARFINLTKQQNKSEEENELIARTLRFRRLHTVIRENKQRRIIEVPHQDHSLVEMLLT